MQYTPCLFPITVTRSTLPRCLLSPAASPPISPASPAVRRGAAASGGRPEGRAGQLPRVPGGRQAGVHAPGEGLGLGTRTFGTVREGIQAQGGGLGVGVYMLGEG